MFKTKHNVCVLESNRSQRMDFQKRWLFPDSFTKKPVDGNVVPRKMSSRWGVLSLRHVVWNLNLQVLLICQNCQKTSLNVTVTTVSIWTKISIKISRLWNVSGHSMAIMSDHRSTAYYWVRDYTLPVLKLSQAGIL